MKCLLIVETNEVRDGKFEQFFKNEVGAGIVNCSCLDRDRPVCGVNGVTYRNLCQAKCKTGGKFKRRPCKTGQ